MADGGHNFGYGASILSPKKRKIIRIEKEKTEVVKKGGRGGGLNFLTKSKKKQFFFMPPSRTWPNSELFVLFNPKLQNAKIFLCYKYNQVLC